MTSQYINKSTHQLQVGDVVVYHGGRFQIREIIDCLHHPISHKGMVKACLSDFIGDLYPDMECSVPKSWRKDWNVQGNDLAMWTVEKQQAAA